jgi:hypothetical protein
LHETEGRRAEAQVLGAEHVGATLVFRVAATEGQGPALREVIGEVRVDGPGLGLDHAAGVGGQATGREQAEHHVEVVRRFRIQVVVAEHEVPLLGVVEELELLAELLVVVDHRRVEIRRGQGVEVDHRLRVVLATRGDGAQGHGIVHLPVHGHHPALVLHLVVAIDPGGAGQGAGAGIGVKHVRRRRHAAEGTGVGAVARHGGGLVIRVVVGGTDQDIVGGLELGGDAVGEDVLVILLATGGQVIAEAVAVEGCHRGAEAEPVRDRTGDRPDEIGLVVGAVAAAQAHVEIVGKAARDVLDRTTDGIAAIQRTLRAAQHLDTLHVVDVQHRALRARQVDIIEVQGDALLEARQRILLADTADERRERGVGGTRRLQGHAGDGLGELRDVLGPRQGQLVTGQGRDGDRHILQALAAAARRDHNLLERQALFLGDGEGGGTER